MRRYSFRGIPALAVTVLLLLTACGAPDRSPKPFPPEGARFERQVFLSARGPDQADARFDLPWLASGETVVHLRSTEPRAMSVAIQCDGAARLKSGGAADAGLFLRPGAVRRAIVPARHDADRLRLVLPSDTTRCRVHWGEDNSLTLVRENVGDPAVAALDVAAMECAPSALPSDPLRRAFFAARDLSLSCPRPIGATAIYPDELDALQLRLERLTGGRVDRAALERGDLDMPLDFSRAPRFDQIVISYLQVRADITGYLVARTLAFHAARGTKVRIVVSDTLTLRLDRRLLEALASQYPNVQIQYFKHRPRGFTPFQNLMANVQNANHIKLFAALSPEPGVSFALVGGRNLHDMFFYPNLENRPVRPFLHDYGTGEPSLSPLNYFNQYEDFEIGLFDRDVVEDVLAHFGRFWNRDMAGDVGLPATSVATASPTGEGLVRYFQSLPWADGVSQEELFVEMIDAARREIIVIVPFLYPTPAIDAALLRAVDRGVRVRLVTRLISGEPAAVLVNSLNSNYAMSRKDKFELLDYRPEGRRLHTKLLIFDERVAIVTSTNLNRRSFLGDTENGLVFLDRAVARTLRAVIEKAAAKARPFPDQPTLGALGAVLSSVPGLANLF